jgi:phosphotransferase system HPr-like phosphotransfer protein
MTIILPKAPLYYKLLRRLKMKELNIKLSTIDDVKSFVNAVTRFSGDADLSSGRYVVDAKSIMGIFSLDLANPIKLTIVDGNADELIADIKAFIVD